jgi:transcriptional regulator with XRE-family HTH domain
VVPNRSKREQSPHRDAAAELGRRLRAARETKRLSQQQLAGLASVAIGTVRALERERSVDPSFFTVLALAQALGLNAVDLIGMVTGTSSAAPNSTSLSTLTAQTSASGDDGSPGGGMSQPGEA